MRARRLGLACAAVSLVIGAQMLRAQGGGAQQGITYRSPSSAALRLMLDETNLGSEVSVGEILFPQPGLGRARAQRHRDLLRGVGEFQHVVNGKSQVLKPGMSGFVRPPDKVRHKTGPAGAKAVVVWAPGDRRASRCGIPVRTREP